MLAAVERGDEEKLAELMRQDPGFNVNVGMDSNGFTLLHHVCFEAHRSPVIPFLLAHPDIDVNMKDIYGGTPFFLASFNGRTSCVRELLKDSRVKVNEPNIQGYTPLYLAAFNGHLEVVNWWIASGWEMNLGEPGDLGKTDASGAAAKYGHSDVATLLKRFQENSVKTRQAVRLKIGWYDEAAADMFALMVFVSDGLLRINDTTPSPTARYFSIAAQLPLELQVVLCHHLVGSPKEIIAGKESEAAFRFLAKRILWSSIFTD